MSQFPGRYERGIPNVAGSRPRGLRNIVGGTIGTGTPDGAPRVSVAPVAPVAPDTTAGSLAEILNRGSQVAAQSLAIYNRNRELADTEFRNQASVEAARFAPELETRFQEAGPDDEILTADPVELASRDAEQFGFTNAAGRQRFVDLTSVQYARQQQDRRQRDLQDARTQSIRNAANVLRFVADSSDPDQEIADALKTITNLGGDPATEILPVLQAAAAEGDERTVDLLGGIVEASRPADFAQINATLGRAQAAGRKAVVDEVEDYLDRYLGLIEQGRGTPDEMLGATVAGVNIGQYLADNPDRAVEIQDKLDELTDERIQPLRRQLEIEVINGDPSAFQTAKQLREADTGDNEQNLFVAQQLNRLRSSEQTAFSLGDFEPQVLDMARGGNYIGADLMIRSARSRGLLDERQARRLQSERQVIQFEDGLAKTNAARAMSPDLQGTGMTFSDESFVAADGERRTVTAERQREQSLAVSMKLAFGDAGRNPMVEFIRGEGNEQDITKQIDIFRRHGYAPDNVISAVTGEIVSGSADPNADRSTAVRALRAYEMLVENGVPIPSSTAEASLTKLAYGMVDRGAANYDNAIAAIARFREQGQDAGDVMRFRSGVNETKILKKVPGEFDDDPHARQMFLDLVRDLTMLRQGEDKAIRSAKQIMDRDYVKVGGSWYNAADLQVHKEQLRTAVTAVRDLAKAKYGEDYDVYSDPISSFIMTGDTFTQADGVPVLNGNDVLAVSAIDQHIRVYNFRRRLAKQTGDTDKFESLFADYFDRENMPGYDDRLQPLVDYMITVAKTQPEREVQGAENARLRYTGGGY